MVLPVSVRRYLSGILLLLFVCAVSWAQAAEKPNIRIIGTGGTIAGVGSSSTNVSAYKSSVVPVDQLMAAVPAIMDVANVTGEQIFQIGSESFDNPHLLKLAHRVSELLKSDDVDGIVITHGTDTLEETSYFLNLTLKSEKPVVLVGATRPSSAMSADGPLNIYNAVTVAADKNAAGKGTLVVMNDEIHSGRDVFKSNSVKVETFRSLYGPLGTVVEGKPLYYRLLARPHTIQTAFDIDEIKSLPEVNAVYSHGNMNRVPYDAFVAAGSKAIIHIGPGPGSVPNYILPVLDEVRGKGVFVIRAAKTPFGQVVRNGEVNDDEHDFIVTDDQNPAKARILMALALLKTSDTKELQRIFWKY